MNDIKIIADSTCDLSADLLKQYDISIIPLCVSMGEHNYFDGVDVTPNDIFMWANKVNSTPKTSAPVLIDVVDLIKPYVERDQDIIFIGISEDMSSTCNVMHLAAEFYDYKKIHIVNSKNLSTGIGLMVLKAATMVKEGALAQTIVSYLEKYMREKVRSSFVIDTLTYLYRGGRCSSITALIGNTFKLKPMIEVKNGKMIVGKKYRGSNKKVLLNYFEDLRPWLVKANSERVFITHSGCDEEIVKELYDRLSDLHIFNEIIITVAGGVISSHCGPKTLGILYVEK